MKQNQLRELALLNGTFRDHENQACQNCGKIGHRKYECPDQRNFSANIICRTCGSAGHMARDCTTRRDPNGFIPAGPPGALPGSAGFDSEYASLMAELGEGAAGIGAAGPDGAPLAIGAGGGVAGGPTLPPWRMPEHWMSNGPQGDRGGPRPQQGFGGPPGYGGGGVGGGFGGGGQGGYGGGPQGGYQPQQQGGFQQQSGGYQQQPQPQQPQQPQAAYSQPGFDQQAAYAQYYQTLQPGAR